MSKVYGFSGPICVPLSLTVYSFLLITSAVLLLSMLVGCGPSVKDLEAVDYTPLSRDDWKVSTLQSRE